MRTLVYTSYLVSLWNTYNHNSSSGSSTIWISMNISLIGTIFSSLSCAHTGTCEACLSHWVQLYVRLSSTLLWGCWRRDVCSNLELTHFYTHICMFCLHKNLSSFLGSLLTYFAHRSHCKHLHVSSSVCLVCKFDQPTEGLFHKVTADICTCVSLLNRNIECHLYLALRASTGGTALVLDKPHEWIMNIPSGVKDAMRKRLEKRGDSSSGCLNDYPRVLRFHWLEMSRHTSASVFIQDINNIYHLFPDCKSLPGQKGFRLIFVWTQWGFVCSAFT